MAALLPVAEAKSAPVESRVYAIPWLSLGRPSRAEILVFNPDVGVVKFHAAEFDESGSLVAERTMASLPGQAVTINERSEDHRASWMKITASGRVAGSCTLAHK